MQFTATRRRRLSLRLPNWKVVDRRVARAVVLTALALVFVLSLILSIAPPNTMDRGFLSLSIFLAGCVLTLQLFYKATGPRPVNWLTVDLLTMVPFSLVHFSFVVYWLLGKEHLFDRNLWDSARGGDARHLMCYATIMSVSALAAFALGFNFLPDRFARVRPLLPGERKHLQQWRVAGFRALMVSAISGTILIAALGSGTLHSRYGGTDTGNTTLNQLLKLSMLFQMAGVTLLAVSGCRLRGRLAIGLVSGAVIALYVCAFLIHGDRNVFLTTTLVIMLAYSEYAKPISFKTLVVVAFLGGALFATVRIARVSRERTLSSMYETVQRHREDIQWDSPIREITMSSQTFYAAVAYVPQQHDYYHGRLFIYDLFALIPFSSRIPVVQRIFAAPRYEETRSSLLLTWVVVGNLDYGGKGTTSAADIYVNFGFFGVVCGLGLLGVGCKYLQQKARQNGSILLGCANCLMAPAMAHVARATIFGTVIYEVLWPVIVIAFLGWIMGIRRSVPNSAIFRPVSLRSAASATP